MPTLAADDALAECLRALEPQTFEPFEVVVVDNSGANRVQATGGRVRVIANDRNVGFGAAINRAIRDPRRLHGDVERRCHRRSWMAEETIEAIEARPEVGMCASEVWLANTGTLDSAGMLIAIDGSSKQRGHGEAPAKYADEQRRAVPQRIGGAVSAEDARRDWVVRRGFFSVLRRY